MIAAVDHPYISSDETILDGEPVINGTRTPVRAIVELYRLGIRPDEIPAHLPHLNLAQIFDSLSFYSDHTEEINAYIVRNRLADDDSLPLNE